MNIENLKKLRDLNTDLEEKKAVIVKKKSDFAMTLQFDNERVESIESQITLYKQGITEEALKECKETGNKKLAGGIVVKTFTAKTISYDKKKALEWGKEKEMFLLFDNKGFDKVAESLNLDFVTVETDSENKVTFPKVIKLEDN